jgi:hypothetical protein
MTACTPLYLLIIASLTATVTRVYITQASAKRFGQAEAVVAA